VERVSIGVSCPGGGYEQPEEQEVPMTRAQTIALLLLAILFLVAVGILTIQVISGGFGLDELPG
jgi:hypothetical protein